MKSPQKHSSAWFAVVCSAAFFAVSNHCNLEALAAHPVSSESCHRAADRAAIEAAKEVPHAAGHAASSARGHSRTSSAPAHPGKNNSVTCCAAMQAVTAPKADFRLASNSAWQLALPALQPAWLAAFLEFSRTASGLSPPAYEPIPARPFYRTAYANHAPPRFLA